MSKKNTPLLKNTQIGSSESQVERLLHTVKTISAHLLKNPKDQPSKRSLIKSVSSLKRLRRYSN